MSLPSVLTGGVGWEGPVTVWEWDGHQSGGGEQLYCASVVFLGFSYLPFHCWYYCYYFCYFILFQLLNYSVSMQEFYLFLILLPIPLAGGGEGLQGQVE